MRQQLFDQLVNLREVAQEIGVVLAVIGGLGLVAAVNVLLWRWAL